MSLSWRVETLRKVCRSLGEMEWVDAALILNQANVRRYLDQDSEYSLYQECIWCLQDESDDLLRELDDLLHSATHTSPSDEPWIASETFKLFLSHMAAHKGVATELTQALGRLGVEGFVAHAAIEPNQEWQRVIEAALASCDGLLALLHSGFVESRWCDQEIGYVLGRHQPVLSLSYEIDPYGFLGGRQALRATENAWENARLIVQTLLDDPRSGEKMSDALVTAICRSTDWYITNATIPLLRDHGSHLTNAHATRLREAQRHNVEVYNATVVRNGGLEAIEARHGIRAEVRGDAPAGFDLTEEPF